jgi:hypothetical protein
VNVPTAPALTVALLPSAATDWIVPFPSIDHINVAPATALDTVYTRPVLAVQAVALPLIVQLGTTGQETVIVNISKSLSAGVKLSVTRMVTG